jgi:hypothetical protein
VPVSAVTRDGDGLPIIWAGRMTRTFTPRWWALISESAVSGLSVIVASRMKLPAGLLSIIWFTWSMIANSSSRVPVGSLKIAPATARTGRVGCRHVRSGTGAGRRARERSNEEYVRQHGGQPHRESHIAT